MHFQIELFKWMVDRLLYKFGKRDTCLEALDGNDENVRWPFNQCNRVSFDQNALLRLFSYELIQPLKAFN